MMRHTFFKNSRGVHGRAPGGSGQHKALRLGVAVFLIGIGGTAYAGWNLPAAPHYVVHGPATEGQTSAMEAAHRAMAPAGHAIVASRGTARPQMVSVEADRLDAELSARDARAGHGSARGAFSRDGWVGLVP